MALLVVLFQGTWALAGTTGALTGNVVLSDGTALAGAKVDATSPSEAVSTTTDASGHFAFVSLIPDTYTVLISKDGYDSVSQAGVTVFADNTQTVRIVTQASAKVLGRIPVTASAALVKPGTTADVYSVNARTSGKLVGLGGGGGLDNAYSALAALPGLYVPQGQTGWYQAVYIRGGDYDQVGYEYDGVPVNRSFDNYPTTTASSLGQQQLQVYTGGAPANAESQGLSGFINQVIRTGSYPGFGTLDVGIGGPALYNKINIEVGGATPNRNFSYYVGIGGYNSRPRYYDQANGASLTQNYGTPFISTRDAGFFGTCSVAVCYNNDVGAVPNGYVMAPWNLFNTYEVADRETIANIHIGLPHHNDSGKDDIQLLYSTSLLRNPYYSSAQDVGIPFMNQFGPTVSGIAGAFAYFGGFQYNGPLLSQFTGGVVPGIIGYSAPSSGIVTSSPTLGGLFPAIPASLQDSSENGQGIGKIQYQHNIGSGAYLRIYGYSYYSWWFLHGANSDNYFYVGCCPDDYELETHTRGASLQFQDQINAKNLLGFQLSYTTASTVRDNNTQGFGDVSGTRSRFAVLVNGANPQSGLCYNTTNTATAVSCEPFTLAATFVKYTAAANGTEANVAGLSCGGGPCVYQVVETGPWATYNTVKPVFSGVSLTDQLKATDKLQLDLGLRVDRYEFKGANTTGGARNFWFNAWNQSQCVSTVPGSKPIDKSAFLSSISLPCSALNPILGGTYVPAILQNVVPDFTYTETEPRLGATFAVSADDVLRFSYGKIVQPPNAAFEQYNSLEQNLPARLGNVFNFFAYGFNTPGHQLGPEVSYNTDFSWEHHFKGSDVSFKLSPYYRKTKDQYQQFFLDQVTGFVSGLPVGNQISEGVEFQIAKGDFSANGLSGQLSYTYLHAYTTLSQLSNGGTVFSPINIAIGKYNAYTRGCAGNTTNPTCGGGFDSLGHVAAACYTSAGVPDPTCATAGDIANPYWNAPVQTLFDVNAHYIPFDIIPNGFNSAVASYEVPHVASLILNWKHDKFAVTPALQYHAGGYYGAPLQTPGIDPAGGCASLGTSPTGDPRYPYGASGGQAYNAPTCLGHLLIPDPYTGAFDQPGAFRLPSQMTLHLQLTYEASSRVTLVGNVVNLYNHCFGGNGPAFLQLAAPSSTACGVTVPGFGGVSTAVGNFYNPGDSIQQWVKYPYEPTFGIQPIAYGIEAKLSL